MNSNKNLRNGWTKIFFEEAERWSCLPYGHKCIENFIEIVKNAESQKQKVFIDEYKKHFEKMEEEEFDCFPIYAFGTTITCQHREIWEENPVECAKTVLTSLIIESSDLNQSEEYLKQQLYMYIQEGLLGNIEVVDVRTMKEDCMMYYDKACRYLEVCWHNPKIDHTDYPNWEKRMDVVKEQLSRLDTLPMQMKVIRTNILGEHLSQVYDSEYASDLRNVIKEKRFRDECNYIMIIGEEVYIVNISDPY